MADTTNFDYDWAEIEKLVPGLRGQPGDHVETIEGIRAGLFEELAPQTDYEQIVAGNLVALELEAIRLREMLDRVTFAALREVLEDIPGIGVDRSESESGFYDAHEDAYDAEIARARGLYRQLVKAGISGGDAVAKILEDRGVDSIGILARIRLEHAASLEPFESRLLAIETRRRRLMADYNLLIARRPLVDQDEDEDEDEVKDENEFWMSPDVLR